jgi:hypothetical protein
MSDKSEQHSERIERAIEKYLEKQAQDDGLSHRERAKRRTLARRQGRRAKVHREEQ